MGVSNLGFAVLAALGHSNLGHGRRDRLREHRQWLWWRGGGGLLLRPVQSAVHRHPVRADLALAPSIVGRLLTGTTAGALIESLGFVNFYLLTTLLALPGILLFSGT